MHLISVVQQGLDVAKLFKKGTRCHEADALHPRHIVGDVAHEREYIHKLAGFQAVELLPKSAGKDDGINLPPCYWWLQSAAPPRRATWWAQGPDNTGEEMG